MSEKPDWKEFAENIKATITYVQPVVAIWLVSILEALLEDFLIKKMRPISNNFQERLFENYGPLSSLSARIDVAYALSVFDDSTFETLKVIKEIRNEFAHPKGELLHFNEERITKILSKIKDRKDGETNAQLFLRKITDCLEAMNPPPEYSELLQVLKSIKVPV